MDFRCPHCGYDFTVEDPFVWPEPRTCHLCGRRVYLEIDESDEGPLFTLYANEPDSRLYPDGKRE